MKARLYRFSDLSQIIYLFRNTVHAINKQHYNEVQINTWAPENIDEKKWHQRLSENYSVVIEQNDMLLGFGELKNHEWIDTLYVHQDFQKQGVASLLLETLELQARKHHVMEIATEASITARSFFESKKYILVREQNKILRDIVFINYIMSKKIL
jgi:putative acetyltransferase